MLQEPVLQRYSTNNQQGFIFPMLIFGCETATLLCALQFHQP